MTPFITVDDQFLADKIRLATRRVVYVAPGVGVESAKALVAWSGGQATVVLDADPDVCRIGYGEVGGLEVIGKGIADGRIEVQRQSGLRVGLLVADDTVLIWAPTAQAVEKTSVDGEPNALMLTTSVGTTLADALQQSAAEAFAQGRLDEHTVQHTIADLKANPPAPFDLSQRARVFSTKYQFVEFEVRGAEWTERRMRLSSLFVNADLPEEVRDILDTQIRPFQTQGDLEFDVPGFLNGQPAHDATGKRIMVKKKQADVLNAWSVIRGNYLRHIAGFGWLIRRDQIAPFLTEKSVFEEELQMWVAAFKEHVQAGREQQVKTIADAVLHRVRRGPNSTKLNPEALAVEISKGLDRLRVIEPAVRIVFKDVAWESSRDQAFLDELHRAIPPEELVGWFEEFGVTRERTEGQA